ncbi:hypothetical protein [Chitinophaga sp.]|uniref:DUF6934 family protein n=1 Tax=Chitinophaga sp. TaxID=1869181 RepID=UPI0031DCEE13
MKVEKYVCVPDATFTNFMFESQGPKGVIKKKVKYEKVDNGDGALFNLSFGDYDEITDIISDNSVSNNKDKSIILATVAGTVIDFTDHAGRVYVHAKGSTPSRTRLYQMGINAHREEIEKLFHVFGLRSNEWEKFQPGVNYDRFMVIRKKD